MVKAISAMKKDEIRAELELYNVEYSSRDTVPELEMMLKAARADRDVKLSSQIKKEEGQKDQTKGLTSKTKLQLQNMCTELEISFTTHTTKNDLIAKIISSCRDKEVPCHTDLVDIGKFKMLTYQEVLTQQPGYCRWVKDTCEEEGASPHPLMKRLYRYIMNPPETTLNHTKVKVEKKDLETPLTPRTIDRVRQHLIKEAQSSSGGVTGSNGSAMTDGGSLKRVPPPRDFDPELYPSMDLGAGIRTPIPKLQSFRPTQ
jgi:hypothetical protein